MPHNAVPCSSHQSVPATSLYGTTVGLPFVLYLHGHGLQDIRTSSRKLLCSLSLTMWRGWALSLPEEWPTENWALPGKNAEKIQPGLRAACLLRLLTWLFLFCSSKRGKMRGKASAQGHRDWQGASLRKQPAVSAFLTLSSSLAAIFSSLAARVLLHSFQSTGCTTIKTAKKNA